MLRLQESNQIRWDRIGSYESDGAKTQGKPKKQNARLSAHICYLSAASAAQSQFGSLCQSSNKCPAISESGSESETQAVAVAEAQQVLQRLPECMGGREINPN